VIATGPDAVQVAFEKWAAAPMHIKAMAGAYVVPLLEALAALSQDQQLILDQLEQINQWKK